MVFKYSALFALLCLVVSSLLALIFNMMEWNSLPLQFLLGLFIAANLTGVRFVKDHGRGFEKPERLGICVGSLLAMWLVSILGGAVAYWTVSEATQQVVMSTLSEQPLGFFGAMFIFVSGMSYLVLFITYGPITSNYAEKNKEDENSDDHQD